MKADRSAHLSDAAFAQLDAADATTQAAQLAHLQACSACARRRDELAALRALLARAGQRELPLRRDIVPSAVKRLRLRRHAASNANEIVGTFAALLRGLTSLFGVTEADPRG